MSKQIAAGIDIGTHEVKVLIGEKDGEKSGGLPVIIGAGSSNSRGLRYGYIVNQPETTKGVLEAIRIAEKIAKVKVKKAYLAVGGVGLESFYGSGVEIISRADSEVTDLDVGKAINSAEESLRTSGTFLNKKIIHRVPLIFKIDGKEILGRAVGMRGGKLEVKVLFITSMEQHLNDLIQSVEEAGIDIENVYASPFAASLAVLSKTQKVAGCVLANIGAETVSIAVFENNMPISIKVFPIGGTDITNDIALGLQIPLEEAEAVKLGGVTGATFPKKKLDEIIDARLSDIFELIENHLKKIGKNGLLPAGIIITGGGSGIATIEDLAKSALKLPSQAGSLKSLNNFRGAVKDSTWAVAYGLCIAGLGEENGEVKYGRLKEGGKSIGEWLKQFLP